MKYDVRFPDKQTDRAGNCAKKKKKKISRINVLFDYDKFEEKDCNICFFVSLYTELFKAE